MISKTHEGETMVEMTFKCSICGETYDARENALACEDQGIIDPAPDINVGDIVLARAGFCWFDGDPAWVSNPEVGTMEVGKIPSALKLTERRLCPHGDGNCFSPCCTYSFYYVVTAKESVGSAREGAHRLVLHLETKAMLDGYRGGWTVPKTHYTPIRVENPPEVVIESSKELIGHTFGWLL